MQHQLELSEQNQHLERVTSRIGAAIVAFCRDNPQFHAENLRKYVGAVCGSTAPASADRILRDLRKRGVLHYTVLNRRQSLYAVTVA